MNKLDLDYASASGCDNSTASASHKSEDDASGLALRETRKARRVRFLLVCVLSLVAMSLAGTIYYLSDRSEKEMFSANFEDRVAKIVNELHNRMEQKIAVLEALSFDMTSYAMHTNKTWPFVVIPDFALKAAEARSLSQSVSIIAYPYIRDSERSEWETFSTENLGWLDDGLEFEHGLNSASSRQRNLEAEALVSETITRFNDDGELVTAPEDSGPFFPAWQSSPVASMIVNFDLRSTDLFSQGIDAVWESREAVIEYSVDGSLDAAAVEAYKESWEQHHFYDIEGPVAKLYFPIFNELDPKIREPVSVMTSALYWESFFVKVLPPHQDHIDVVLKSACDQQYTFSIHDGKVKYVGPSDYHDSRFDSMAIEDTIFSGSWVSDSVAKYNGVPLNDLCTYQLRVYPTQALEDQYRSPTPWILCAVVLSIFAFTIFLIYCYDKQVESNYQQVYVKAKQAGAIVSSMFPAAVRRRLYRDEAEESSHTMSQSKDVGTGAFKQKLPSAVGAQKLKLKGFLTTGDDTEKPASHAALTPSNTSNKEESTINCGHPHGKADKPIADRFSAVTILFADIVGFGPWSSQRDPAEIFTFLQTLYQEFDNAAREMKVFKVETVGDCYVAATGLPEPQDDHALRMTRFAAKIVVLMAEVTRRLEVRLGPDTGDLSMRVGLHSGPVTAGVLKGAKARFQLFGDTMNVAARMEQNSQPNRIQCSEVTAELLQTAGKEHWLKPREGKIEAKGKGLIQTYWVLPKAASSDSGDDNDRLSEALAAADAQTQIDISQMSHDDHFVVEMKTPGSRSQRLIDWNVELLAALLKQIEAHRRDTEEKTRARKQRSSVEKLNLVFEAGSSARDEVAETIELPSYKEKSKKKKRTNPKDIELDMDVTIQLRDYVTTIASMYHDNAFHNFDHASHVTMSTNKLLKRVLVKDVDEDHETYNAVDLHDYTYGITSDPLTQFALVFCALIHDVDHAGVSNFQLIQENCTLAKLYQNKSVAEQNSVDLAWDLLMDPSYSELRKAIYANDEDLRRFRQLVVNIVLATDIFDSDMKDIRERRWGRAFQYEDAEEQKEEVDEAKLPVRALERSDRMIPLDKTENANLKATIVMEHLIQASDVAHTMQHWEIYMKWNERLFNEMFSAYENGRAARDPSAGWYEGEIMFFDRYIIPLAKKLNDCGVFGVSSDECLNYAKQNRKKWAIEGDKIVEKFIQRYKEKNRGKEVTV